MKRALVACLLLIGCSEIVLPGKLCRSDDDCKSLKNGWCAKVEICTRDCQTVPCPTGSTCVTEGPRRVCLASCTTTDDCLPNFTCTEKPEGNVCELANPFGPPPA